MATSCCHPPATPARGERRRRTLRQVVADRRAARSSRHPDGPASGLAEWLAERQQLADRLAETLRTRATDPDPAAGRQEHGDPPAELVERDRPDQEQERDREPEDDFGDSWRTYREHTDQIRQTYGWTVPEPPPRAEPWLPLGRDDDQERDREDR